LHWHTPNGSGLALAWQDRQFVAVPEQVTHTELHETQFCALVVENAPGTHMHFAGAAETSIAFVAQDIHWFTAAPWQDKQSGSQVGAADTGWSERMSDMKERLTIIISGSSKHLET
jgi:hypothetical protein